MNSLALLVFSFIITPIFALWQAFVASFLWVWFVTPIFDIPSPSLWMLAGLSIFLSLIINRAPAYDKDASKTDKVELYVYIFVVNTITPLSALIFGWLYHSFS